MASPIELTMLKALRETRPSDSYLMDFSDLARGQWSLEAGESGLALASDEDSSFCEFGTEESAQWLALYSDVTIASYRADIIIDIESNGSGNFLCVECDGHDFHDRTKHQAAYDRARDRELLLLGVPTIRYTGSEIHHSAHRCAVEVWRIVERFDHERNTLPQESFRRGWDCGKRFALEPKGSI